MSELHACETINLNKDIYNDEDFRICYSLPILISLVNVLVLVGYI